MKISLLYNGEEVVKIESNSIININYVYRSSKLDHKMMIECYGDINNLIEVQEKFANITNFDTITFNDSVLVKNIIIDGAGTGVDAYLSKVGVLNKETFNEMVCNITIDIRYPEKELKNPIF